MIKSMLTKLACIFRWLIVRINNIGRVSIPIHSRLASNTKVYTSNGKIKFGMGFISSTNTAFSALDGGEMIIGKRVVVNRNSMFICRKRISIGDHCTFGPNVCIYDHDHYYGIEGVKPGYKYGDVVIDDHCWIGAGTIILRGSHIGEGSIVGAGCVIKDNIPPHSLVTMERQLKIREISND